MRRYNREFKISVVSELKGGKPPAQIARERGIHPSLPSQWRDELAENSEKAFGCNKEHQDHWAEPWSTPRVTELLS
jgi:transposase-like protein